MNLTWTGSDVLYCTKYPKHSKKTKYLYMFGMRIFAKLADIFCQKHIVVSEHLIAELKPLKLKKPIEVRANHVIYPNPVRKIEHKGFNVLYYRGLGANQKFKDWVYGKDIMNDVKLLIEYDINIIEVNGKANMAEVYPIIDFMVRPNRHDGNPRMIRECEINNIPYYWSKENPDTIEIMSQILKRKDAK